MEKLHNVVNLLSSVVSTMDTIPVIGIDNQDKFVGCAATVVMAKNHLQEYIAALPEKTHPDIDGKEPEHG